MTYLKSLRNWIAIAPLDAVKRAEKEFIEAYRTVGDASKVLFHIYSFEGCSEQIERLKFLVEDVTVRGYGHLAFLRSARGTYRIGKTELDRIGTFWNCIDDLDRLAQLCVQLQKRRKMTAGQRESIAEILRLIAVGQNLGKEILKVAEDLQEWTTEALLDRAQVEESGANG